MSLMTFFKNSEPGIVPVEFHCFEHGLTLNSRVQYYSLSNMLWKQHSQQYLTNRGGSSPAGMVWNIINIQQTNVSSMNFSRCHQKSPDDSCKLAQIPGNHRPTKATTVALRDLTVALLPKFISLGDLHGKFGLQQSRVLPLNFYGRQFSLTN